MKGGFALGFIFIFAGFAARAADGDLCRPFATQYTQLIMNKVWLRAYTACLNSDEVPSIPDDWITALKRALPDATPLVVPLAQEGTVPATAAKPPASPTPTPTMICTNAHKHIIWKGKSWRCQ